MMLSPSFRQLLLLAVVTSATTAFVVVTPYHGRVTSSVLASSSDDEPNRRLMPMDLGKALATSFLVTASLWSTPAITSTYFPQQQAMAKEMASGSGARVNKDPESLLRYGLPINNKEVRMI